MTSLALYLLLLPAASLATAGLFDLSELRRISYDASIGNDFLWFAPDIDIRDVSANNIDDLEQRILSAIPEESHEKYVFVTSRAGQRFVCSLPEVEAFKKPDAPRSSKNPKIYADAIAASFYVEKCIKMRGNHWWSYVFCRGQTVEQEHGERGQEEYTKNILGLFDGNYSMPPYHESTDDRLLYVEESYSSGTFCDLPEYKEPRKTTVRYECDTLLSTNEAYIQSVAELRPCQYLMTVKVGTLCHFPEFLPIGQANTHTVGCQPYLSKSEVREMLERQLDEQKQKAVREQRALDAKHNYLVASDRFVAMSKAERKFHDPDRLKVVNAEMDFTAAHLDLMIANFENAGHPITMKELDTLHNALNIGNIADYQLYVDYDSIEDENRGHLWYYFHDPSWPKSQFPKDIYKTAIQNEYFDDVTDKVARYETDKEYYHGIREFLRTGTIDLGNHMAVSASAVYFHLVDEGLKNTTKEHQWLHRMYELLHEDTSEDIEELLIFIDEREEPSLPFDYHSLNAVEDWHEELLKAIARISRLGERIEHVEDPLTGKDEPKRQNFLLEFLKMNPADEKLHAAGFKHVFSIKNETRTLLDLEKFFGDLFTPFCQILSIRWFQARVQNYFHLHPLDGKYLTDPKSRDYQFHRRLARDFVDFRRLLAVFTLKQLQNVELLQFKKNSRIPRHNPEKFIDAWNDKTKAEYDRKFPESFESAVETSFARLFDYSQFDRPVIDQAVLTLWEKKIHQFRFTIWRKDYQKRKEAQSISNTMQGLLSSKDDSARFPSISGKGKKGKKSGKGKDIELSMDELRDGLELLKSKLGELFVEDSDESVDMDDMRGILDLLEKTGLDKSADVQIKMFDENGNEIKDLDEDPAVKSLLDEMDSIARFRDNEKAYSTKPLSHKTDEKNDKEPTVRTVFE